MPFLLLLLPSPASIEQKLRGLFLRGYLSGYVLLVQGGRQGRLLHHLPSRSVHVDPKFIWHVDGTQAYPPALKTTLGARMDKVNHSRPQKKGGPQWTKLCKHKLPSNSKGLKKSVCCTLPPGWPLDMDEEIHPWGASSASQRRLSYV